MFAFHIITIFPESFKSYLATSILARARKEGLMDACFYDSRDYTDDKHRTVDDTPYGGGAGMVMKALPIVHTVDAVRESLGDDRRAKTILLSAKGVQYTQQYAARCVSQYTDIIIIAGRYEGVDERVLEMTGADEVSIGPYVLTDGELPAMVLVSSMARLVPGAIAFESLEEESHLSAKQADWGNQLDDEEIGELEYPHYTRPETIEYKGEKYTVPEILLSGNHAEIERWRKEMRGKLQ